MCGVMMLFCSVPENTKLIVFEQFRALIGDATPAPACATRSGDGGVEAPVDGKQTNAAGAARPSAVLPMDVPTL